MIYSWWAELKRISQDEDEAHQLKEKLETLNRSSISFLGSRVRHLWYPAIGLSDLYPRGKVSVSAWNRKCVLVWNKQFSFCEFCQTVQDWPHIGRSKTQNCFVSHFNWNKSHRILQRCYGMSREKCLAVSSPSETMFSDGSRISSSWAPPSMA